MGFLRFAQETPGEYFVIGHNDEELYVVAELLLNPDARNLVKELLESSESRSAKIGLFSFHKHPYNLIDISYEKPAIADQKSALLEISIDSVMLDDILDAWEFYMLSHPAELVLSRRHDSDAITLSHETFREE
jgi:hypothetical protein